MGVPLNQILPLLNKLAPAAWAESWDRVGLQLGDTGVAIDKILVCLDVLPAVVEEARQRGAQLLISHHPLFFTPISSLNFSSPAGRLISDLVKAELNVYVVHTNLDVAPGGVNDVLARRIGLESLTVLQPQPEELNKLVVFVPNEQAPAVYEAMAKAGAGQIGSYSHCSFWLNGTGTFKPAKDAQPFIGKQDKLNRVAEVRIESLVSKDKLSQVMRAIYRVHPYEEPACDIYPVKNWGKVRGLGRVGLLSSGLTLAELCNRLKQKLNLKGLKLVGNPETPVNKVAVCGGSGGQLMSLAKAAGAQVLVTGDIKYHQALEALSLGLAVVDIGHGPSEKPVIADLAANLSRSLKAANHQVEVVASQLDQDVFCFM